MTPLRCPASPLDAWLAGRMDAAPTPDNLAEYQARRLRETLDLAMRSSPFYRERLDGLEPHVIRRPEDLAVLPRTTAADLAERGDDFLCLSRGDIARVVTLHTSGTTGPAKRIHFTRDDLEATLDFFQHGLTTFAGPEDRVLILLPVDRPDSVGDLLGRAVQRMGAVPVPFGLPEGLRSPHGTHNPDIPGRSPDHALDMLIQAKATCVVGFPVDVLAMARGCRRSREAGRTVRSVLLCSDHVPGSLARSVEEAWDCTVLAHWGMTESGLGGGVECLARCGYHLRETDVYLEVTDPETGRLLAPGRTGEVVLTTLTRRGMPLIRYRTGDMAAMLPGPCPCGSPMRRLGPVCGRRDGILRLCGNKALTMEELDEVLFAVPGLLDFSATLRGTGFEAYLDVRYWSSNSGPLLPAKVSRTLEMLLASKHSGGLRLGLAVSPADGPPTPPGAKRRLRDQRMEAQCENS